MFPPLVERWRHLVELESGLPVNVVLAVIKKESSGIAGEIAKKKTKYCVDLPLRFGGTRRSCHALGLMQVIPKNVEHWNKTHKTIFYEDMTGTSSAAAKIQIRIGSSILRGNLTALHTWYPVLFPWPEWELTDDQMMIGLMGYLWGMPRVFPFLKELRSQFVPITFDELARQWPQMGEPGKNRPLKYAMRVEKSVSKWGGGLMTKSPPTKTKAGPKMKSGGDSGLAVAALIGLSVWAFGGD